MISLGIVTTSGEWAGLAEENYANNKVSVAKNEYKTTRAFSGQMYRSSVVKMG